VEILVMTPIIKQCIDRLEEALSNIDDDGNVKLRAESAVMIQNWLVILEKENEVLRREQDLSD
jgi:hypothetical protein